MKKNVAAKLDEDIVFQAVGTVVRVEGTTFIVRSDRGDLRCRRAVSCLVEPMLHDFVMAGGQLSGASGAGATYVLAVLERESPNAQLSCEGDLSLKVGAKLQVVASEGLDLVTPRHMNMTAAEVGIHTSRAKVFASEILAIGSEIVGELANVKLKGTFFDKVFERVTERVQRSFRRVDEIDQLKAKQMDYLAEETLCLRSENMVAVAKELVKVDGEQIHFG
ncbi:MAG: DUF3540 domain-containing protein [Polyangiaceae bacterium]|nr:DUF3540 domain-containing protein [Polyangiaceae bacterium]